MIKKRKNKHDFWKRLHFKYRLSIMNENTLEEIWKIKASMFSGAALVLLFASFLITITSVIIIATPIRYYLPGYLDAEIRGEALRSAIRVDSLQRKLNNQEAYIYNLKDVFDGKLHIDSTKLADTVSISENNPLLQKSKAERDYVQRYEEAEKYNLSVLPSANAGAMEGVMFFKPVRGVVSAKFNPTNDNYGVKLKLASKETVQAVLDGAVVFSGYVIDEGGYTIQIQHKNGFISIYKNNTMLLKKTGDKVRTGEAVAIIGEDKEKKAPSSEMILEFELWYKGNPVNPEDYISF